MKLELYGVLAGINEVLGAPIETLRNDGVDFNTTYHWSLRLPENKLQLDLYLWESVGAIYTSLSTDMKTSDFLSTGGFHVNGDLLTAALASAVELARATSQVNQTYKITSKFFGECNYYAHPVRSQ